MEVCTSLECIRKIMVLHCTGEITLSLLIFLSGWSKKIWCQVISISLQEVLSQKNHVCISVTMHRLIIVFSDVKNSYWYKMKNSLKIKISDWSLVLCKLNVKKHIFFLHYSSNIIKPMTYFTFRVQRKNHQSRFLFPFSFPSRSRKWKSDCDIFFPPNVNSLTAISTSTWMTMLPLY